ncbi:hypothetical protein LUZ61_005096 [Rhynchospora tenuis]|uniref:Uncharacterized protein n=1 Tax=Rhynchospora tenuis TaxID=198213 RepID=A0AAD5ZP19_9POAL|nr:hypothetical protein LUZ61_005096 [Rhynchospora tenuis]
MDRDGGNWLTGIGFTMLTCNSVLAVYRSKDDAWSVAFVLSAYFALVLLFWCLRLYERTAPNAAQRWNLKVAVWSLSTFLTAMFSYKVALLMPWLVALIVWAMAGTVILGDPISAIKLEMNRDGGNWLTTVGFTVLTCNSVLAVYRSKEDAWSVAFVVSAYFALLFLFWCLRLYERTAPNAAQRWKLIVAVWSLSTFLTSMFSYKVANLMPWPVDLVVWSMAASVICGGFYAFFIHHFHQ